MKKATFLAIFLLVSNLYAEAIMKIYIKSNDMQIVYKLNNSNASKELYSQLPLELKVENYSTNEKIFYVPKKLSVENTQLANAKNGTLAYYKPWGNVVMFYEDFGKASGLFELGSVESGKDDISKLSGIIKITKE